MVGYDEIRGYIIEKYNKRVSNKWIAEVKRELGMLQFSVEGEEYEITCPPLAMKYITEAFEYFGIIDERPTLENVFQDEPIAVNLDTNE